MLSNPKEIFRFFFNAVVLEKLQHVFISLRAQNTGIKSSPSKHKNNQVVDKRDSEANRI